MICWSQAALAGDSERNVILVALAIAGTTLVLVAGAIAGPYAGGDPRDPSSPNLRARKDGTIEVWDQRWAPVDSLYFASLDGRRHIGFAQDTRGRITALTAGSWRVLERVR